MGPIPISPVPCSPTYRGSTVLTNTYHIGLQGRLSQLSKVYLYLISLYNSSNTSCLRKQLPNNFEIYCIIFHFTSRSADYLGRRDKLIAIYTSLLLHYNLINLLLICPNIIILMPLCKIQLHLVLSIRLLFIVPLERT